MAGAVRHLLHRAGRYSARVSVPESLRKIVGKRELVRALGADRTGALRKLPGVVAAMHIQLDAARSQSASAAKPKPGRLLSNRQLAETHYHRELELDDSLRNVGRHNASYGELFRPAYVAALTRVASGAAADDEIAAVIQWAIDTLAYDGHLKLKHGSEEWRARARDLAAIQLEVERRKDERDRGEGDGDPRHPLLKAPNTAIDPLNARIMGPDSTKPLVEILPMFIKERRATPATDYECKVTVRMLDEFMGEARPVYRITRQDMQAFKRVLAEAPANYTQRFPDMQLPDAIKANKARNTPFPALNPTTVNDKYLARLHSMLNWCVRNDIIPDNPVTGVKIDGVKATEAPRVQFAPGDLTKIFSSKDFSTSKPLGEPQWAALISLFSGMRASELAQLKLDSIRNERSILVFAVEEATKTLSSQRLIPAHSTLLALGLETRVTNLRQKGETHLFPIWYRQAMQSKQKAANGGGNSAVNHYFPRFIPKRFNGTYLPKVGIRDSRKTWHSFRHTFKTGLARAGVPRSMQDDLCGHADHSAGAGYVHGASVEAMKDAVEKLQFDGFGLS